MRLKPKDIPALRDKIILEQKGCCALCFVDLRTVIPCLDHDHQTGIIRGVLCQNCNGIEGKIHNLVRRAKRQHSKQIYLLNINDYWNKHFLTPRNEFHPTHRTEEEKRLKRNKKARDRRKRLASE